MLKGIDVSLWQGNINWKKAKADGIDFAMIKSSQGGSIASKKVKPFTDRCFRSNIINAHMAGVKCGVYHFLTGTTPEDVEKETDYLISLLEPHRTRITYPVAVDIELARYTKLGKAANTKLVRIFADKIKAAGYTPILYTNWWFSQNYFDLSKLSDVDIWLALYYRQRNCVNKPKGIDNMTIWQWTDKGRVDGIRGCVDCNVAYKDYIDKLGDVNGDGKINAKDVLMAKRHVIGNLKLTDEQLKRADIDGDGKVDSKDALKIKRHILGTYQIKRVLKNLIK